MELSNFREIFQDMGRPALIEKTGELFSNVLLGMGKHVGHLVHMGGVAAHGLWSTGPPGMLASAALQITSQVAQNVVESAISGAAEAIKTAAEFSAYEHRVQSVFTRFFATILPLSPAVNLGSHTGRGMHTVIRFDECWRIYRQKQIKYQGLRVDMDTYNKQKEALERDASASLDPVTEALEDERRIWMGADP